MPRARRFMPCQFGRHIFTRCHMLDIATRLILSRHMISIFDAADFHCRRFIAALLSLIAEVAADFFFSR